MKRASSGSARYIWMTPGGSSDLPASIRSDSVASEIQLRPRTIYLLDETEMFPSGIFLVSKTSCFLRALLRHLRASLREAHFVPQTRWLAFHYSVTSSRLSPRHVSLRALLLPRFPEKSAEETVTFPKGMLRVSARKPADKCRPYV